MLGFLCIQRRTERSDKEDAEAKRRKKDLPILIQCIFSARYIIVASLMAVGAIVDQKFPGSINFNTKIFKMDAFEVQTPLWSKRLGTM